MAIDPKKALGRPTLYRAKYCDALIEHMKQGFSFEAFGAVANVSERTLFDWVKAFPEFREAKELGLSHALLAWERMGMVLIARGGGNGSAAVYIFNMKNRFGYRNEPGPGIEAKDEDEKKALDPSRLSDEELSARIRAKLSRLGKKP